MKKIILNIFMAFALFAFFLSACDDKKGDGLIGDNTTNAENSIPSTDDTYKNNSSEPIYGLINPKESFIDPIALLNDSVIYTATMEIKTDENELGSYNEEITYYRHYFGDDKAVKIGSVDNYAVGSGQVFMIGNTLYSLITTAQSAESIFEQNDYGNMIVVIDLETNTLTYQVFNPNGERYLPEMLIRKYNDELLILRNLIGDMRDASTTTSFIQVFDLIKNISVRESEKVLYTMETDTGFTIDEISVYNDKIYVWQTESNGEFWTPQSESYEGISTLSVYNIKLEKIGEIDLSGIPDSFVLAGRFKLTFWDDFIHIYNYNRGYGLIGIIENNKIKPLLIEQDLRAATTNYPATNPVFFKALSNKIFTVDKDTKEVKEHEFYVEPLKTERHTMPNGIEQDVEIGYVIQYIVQNNENLFIDMFYLNPVATKTEEDLFYHTSIGNVISSSSNVD